jgi:exo-poly-alpha-galacturonosidase
MKKLRLLLISSCLLVTSIGVTGCNNVKQEKSANKIMTPQKLSVPALAYDDKSITLVWNKPDDYSNITDYNIYMNDKLIGNANKNTVSSAKPFVDKFYEDSSNSDAIKVSQHSYIVTGLEPSKSYTFKVRAVDSNGKESADSNTVTQETTATPKTFNIVDYGAVGDGVTLNTKAIEEAVKACTEGGKVVIPDGNFKSGPFTLKSDMIFQVDGTLIGSDNADDYSYADPTYKKVSKSESLITIEPKNNEELKNIKIVGKGKIDGNGWKQGPPNELGFPQSLKSSLDTIVQNGTLAAAQYNKAVSKGMKPKDAYATRSNLIAITNVTNLYYGDGLTMVNPSRHILSVTTCKNVTLNCLKIETFDCNNGDGMDVMNSDGLTVMNSVFDTGDDCIDFNAGKGASDESKPPVKNIWIFNNYFGRGHGAVSSGSNTAAWIQDILAEDNVINGTAAGLRCKTAMGTGGGAKNIVFRDSALKNITDGEGKPFIFTSDYTDPGAVGSSDFAKDIPQFKNITVKNCTVDTSKENAIFVSGLDGGYHEDIHFENVSFKNTKEASINYMKNSSFKNVTFDDKVKEPWNIKNSVGVTFDK